MVKVTATELKNNLSDILSKVSYGNTVVSVIKHNKEVARIIPSTDNSDNEEELFEKLDKKYRGSIPDLKQYKRKTKTRRWKI